MAPSCSGISAARRSKARRCRFRLRAYRSRRWSRRPARQRPHLRSPRRGWPKRGASPTRRRWRSRKHREHALPSRHRPRRRCRTTLFLPRPSRRRRPRHPPSRRRCSPNRRRCRCRGRHPSRQPGRPRLQGRPNFAGRWSLPGPRSRRKSPSRHGLPRPRHRAIPAATRCPLRFSNRSPRRGRWRARHGRGQSPGRRSRPPCPAHRWCRATATATTRSGRLPA
jgi:hypothetical protein